MIEMNHSELETVRGGLYEETTSSDDGGEVVIIDGQPFLKTLRVAMSGGSYSYTWWYTPYTP